jgi:hypothetical protein
MISAFSAAHNSIHQDMVLFERYVGLFFSDYSEYFIRRFDFVDYPGTESEKIQNFSRSKYRKSQRSFMEG